MGISQTKVLAKDIVNTVMTGSHATPFALARKFGLSVEQAREIADYAPSMFGPGGKGFDAYVKRAESVIKRKARPGEGR